MFTDHPSNWLAIALYLPALTFATLFLSQSKFVVKTVVLISFVKISLILINAYFYQFFSFDADFYTLNSRAQALAALPLWDMLKELPEATGRYFFSFLMALLYRAVGEAYLFILFSNVFLTAVVAVCTYDAALSVTGSKRVARAVLLLTAFFPMYFIYCLTPSREPLVEAAFAVALKYFCYWSRDSRAARIPLIIAGLVIASAIHSAMAIAMLFILGCMAAIVLRRSRKSGANRTRLVISGFVLLLVATMVMPPVILSGWALKKFGGDIGGVADAENFEKYADRNDGDARTGYTKDASGTEFSSFSGMAKELPMRLVYFATKPWPWNISSPFDLIAIYINIFLVLTLFYAAFKRSELGSFPPSKYVALCVLLLSVVFALGTANWGTGTRHKTKFFPALAIITAVYLANRRNAGGVGDSMDLPSNRALGNS